MKRFINVVWPLIESSHAQDGISLSRNLVQLIFLFADSNSQVEDGQRSQEDHREKSQGQSSSTWKGQGQIH